MLNRRYRPAVIASIAAAMCVLSTQAQADTYTWNANGGTGGDWGTAANWYDTTAGANATLAPGSTDDVNITTHNTAADPVTITSAANANSIVAPYTSDKMYLDISANLTVVGTFGVASKGTGVVVQTAGEVTAGTLSLNSSTNTVGTGSYTLTGTGSVQATTFTANGGTDSVFTQNGSGTTVQFGNVTSANNSGGDRWTYNLMAGNLTITGNTSRTYGGWYFNQTGGTASVGELDLGTGYRAGVAGMPMEWRINGNSSLSIGGNVTLGWVGDGGTHTGAGVEGQFTLDGSRGTGSNVTVTGNWRQTGALTPGTTTDSWGRLEGIIDTTAINTPSDMREINVTGNVTFDDESYLLPEFDPSATPTAGTWTLMTWDGTLTNNGLTFDPSVDVSVDGGVGWTFNLDSADKTLSVTYIAATSAVPEPASLALLGVGGLMMIRRRRKA